MASRFEQPSQRRKWRGCGRGARPPGTNIKGQSLPPGRRAKFPFYLKPGPQWGIVSCLKGHRAAPEWTQTDSTWQSKQPPGRGQWQRSPELALSSWERALSFKGRWGLQTSRPCSAPFSVPQFPHPDRGGPLILHPADPGK